VSAGYSGPASRRASSARGFPRTLFTAVGRLRQSRGSGARRGKTVSYLNDGKCRALWGHYTIFGANSRETSVSTNHRDGNGRVILVASVVKGKNVFGGNRPRVTSYHKYRWTRRDETGMQVRTHRGPGSRFCSSPRRKEFVAIVFAAAVPVHDLAKRTPSAAKQVRGLAGQG